MCLYPRLIENPKYKITKKNGGEVPPILDNRVKFVPIGCGNCYECRKQKYKEWKVRLLEDSRTNTNGRFVTLTFSNESIKKLSKDIDSEGYERDNEIATLAVRRFLERWRKKYKVSVRHWLITELGHRGTENIHLHGIIWTSELSDIEKIWNYGYVYIGYSGVNEATANYISKYILKSDFNHKEFKGKILCSKGIGGNYKNRLDSNRNLYKKNETKEYYVDKEGIKNSLPKYYRNQLYSEEERELLWLEKLDKNERWVLGVRIDVSTYEGEEEYYRALSDAQNKNKRLGYGSNEIDWERKKYEIDRRNMLFKKRIMNGCD